MYNTQHSVKPLQIQTQILVKRPALDYLPAYQFNVLNFYYVDYNNSSLKGFYYPNLLECRKCNMNCSPSGFITASQKTEILLQRQQTLTAAFVTIAYITRRFLSGARAVTSQLLYSCPFFRSSTLHRVNKQRTPELANVGQCESIQSFLADCVQLQNAALNFKLHKIII
ncbi:Hypothetical_protein [Hexamita inflata]|uniref:Hypothetical_protein n=1 Tax=Hexamita inflata TaxID=28002 RepID=A0AA86U949_9EUKA|nr:Hypothetical protein HINF_LOCUS29912 [Hexamita inflata]CAI9942274.1 Hypothetical protein HINF_LOCUS29919 [Hexamita inflata]